MDGVVGKLDVLYRHRLQIWYEAGGGNVGGSWNASDESQAGNRALSIASV